MIICYKFNILSRMNAKIPKLVNRLKLATILQTTSIFGLFTMLIVSYYYYKHKSYNDAAYNYYKQKNF